MQTQWMKRLRPWYEGRPGEKGYVRLVKVLDVCMVFTSILFKKHNVVDGKEEKTKGQVYKDIAAVLTSSKYQKELFGGLLEAPGVCMISGGRQLVQLSTGGGNRTNTSGTMVTCCAICQTMR